MESNYKEQSMMVYKSFYDPIYKLHFVIFREKNAHVVNI